jgi:hypothetical protein
MTHLRELNIDLGPTNGVIAPDGKIGVVGTGNMLPERSRGNHLTVSGASIPLLTIESGE